MWQRVVPLALAGLSFCLPAQDQQQNPKEAALGAFLASQVRRQATPLGLARVDEYVKRLGLQLAAQMPNAPEDWTFTVVRDHEGGSTEEPLWLPGGYLFVPAGLILAAHDEGELAGMLAHAMAHVAKRQALHQATRGEIARLANIPLVFMVGVAGLTGADEHPLVPVGLLKTRRQFELEADQVAVEVMAATGFDPHALLSYIERVQPPRSMYAEEFSPFPPLSVRMSQLKQAIQNLSAPTLPLSTEPFRSVQNEVSREQSRLSTPKEAPRIPSLRHPN